MGRKYSVGSWILFSVPHGDGAVAAPWSICSPQFHPARAQIRGKTVVVTGEAVPEPVAVRYGWANVPEGNLFNKAGLPASPFGTDGK